MNTKDYFPQLAASFPISFDERKAIIQMEIKRKKEQGDWALFLLHKSSSLPDAPGDMEQDALLIHGCLYRVWLMATPQEGKLIISAKSDSRIMKGALVLLIQMLSGLSFKEIIQADLSFIYQEMSSSSFPSARSTSLRNVEDRIKMLARQMISKDLLRKK